jgi:GntR family transcriptional repressor for pyruvate dehydrogenase complex
VKVITKKVSEQVAEQLERQIVEGELGAGAKLSSERDLAESYGVSRPSIRDAIKKLEAKGLVTRKQGGGTFVSSKLVDPFAAPLFELLANSPDSHYDLLEFRFALEGVIAYYAALRGTEQDKAAIESAFAEIEKMNSGSEPQKVAEAIVHFYLTIAEASHNVMLMHLLRGLSELLVHNVKDNLAVFAEHEDIRQQLNQHRTLLKDAIVQGDAELARETNRKHLAFIEKSLLQLDQQQSAMQSTVKRLLKPTD